MSIIRHTVSVKYACEGIVQGLKTQPNFRIHLLLSLLSITLSILLQISLIEFIIILLTIGLGLAIEYLNTAVEFTVDLLTDKHHLLAKYAKDCAAAAMLVYAFFAALIAAIIFIPRILVW